MDAYRLRRLVQSLTDAKKAELLEQAGAGGDGASSARDGCAMPAADGCPVGGRAAGTAEQQGRESAPAAAAGASPSSRARPDPEGGTLGTAATGDGPARKRLRVGADTGLPHPDAPDSFHALQWLIAIRDKLDSLSGSNAHGGHSTSEQAQGAPHSLLIGLWQPAIHCMLIIKHARLLQGAAAVRLALKTPSWGWQQAWTVGCCGASSCTWSSTARPFWGSFCAPGCRQRLPSC